MLCTLHNARFSVKPVTILVKHNWHLTSKRLPFVRIFEASRGFSGTADLLVVLMCSDEMLNAYKLIFHVRVDQKSTSAGLSSLSFIMDVCLTPTSPVLISSAAFHSSLSARSYHSRRDARTESKQTKQTVRYDFWRTLTGCRCTPVISRRSGEPQVWASAAGIYTVPYKRVGRKKVDDVTLINKYYAVWLPSPN